MVNHGILWYIMVNIDTHNGDVTWLYIFVFHMKHHWKNSHLTGVNSPSSGTTARWVAYYKSRPFRPELQTLMDVTDASSLFIVGLHGFRGSGTTLTDTFDFQTFPDMSRYFQHCNHLLVRILMFNSLINHLCFIIFCNAAARTLKWAGKQPEPSRDCSMQTDTFWSCERASTWKPCMPSFVSFPSVQNKHKEKQSETSHYIQRQMLTNMEINRAPKHPNLICGDMGGNVITPASRNDSPTIFAPTIPTIPGLLQHFLFLMWHRRHFSRRGSRWYVHDWTFGYFVTYRERLGKAQILR